MLETLRLKVFSDKSHPGIEGTSVRSMEVGTNISRRAQRFLLFALRQSKSLPIHLQAVKESSYSPAGVDCSSMAGWTSVRSLEVGTNISRRVQRFLLFALRQSKSLPIHLQAVKESSYSPAGIDGSSIAGWTSVRSMEVGTSISRRARRARTSQYCSVPAKGKASSLSPAIHPEAVIFQFSYSP